MSHGWNISPRAQFVAEVLLVLIPSGIALFLSDLLILWKVLGFVGATVVATLAKYLTVYRQRENVKELQKYHGSDGEEPERAPHEPPTLKNTTQQVVSSKYIPAVNYDAENKSISITTRL